MTERGHIEIMLSQGGLAGISMSSRISAGRSAASDFEAAHFIKGFGHPDGKFRFRAALDRDAGAKPAAEKHGPLRAGRSLAGISRIMST